MAADTNTVFVSLSTGDTNGNNSHGSVRDQRTDSMTSRLAGDGSSAPPTRQANGRQGLGLSNYSYMDGAAVGDYDMKKSPSTAAFVHEMMEDRYLSRARQKLVPRLEHLKEESRVAGALLGAATEAVFEGMNAIGEDDFWKCFEKKTVVPWNWNAFLFTMWSLGVMFRYFVLFPIRLVILAIGWILFGSGMLVVQLMPRLFISKALRSSVERTMISWMSSCFVLTWSGVIRYHGHIPTIPKTTKGGAMPKTNFVFVANHSSLIDVIVLQQVKCFSLVGQRHKGLVRFLQDQVLGCLQCIWFDRGEMRDRAIVSKKLSEHAKDPTRNPLLVFPEGTCVNNEHVIQFKKGVFELGVPIAPIAIRYNKLFVDPFWSSRDQSFMGHLVELMTSWCMICDVWFMEPTVRRDGESAEEFAQRVRNSIAEKGGLKPVDWDGYLKHFQPNERLVNQRKQVYADGFKKILDDLQQARLSYNGIVEEGDEDFYIGAPSPTLSVGSENTQDANGIQKLGSASGLPAGPFVYGGLVTAGTSFAPKLGPAALTQRGPKESISRYHST